MMTNRLLIAATASAALLVLSSCAAGTSTVSAPTPSTVTVTATPDSASGAGAPVLGDCAHTPGDSVPAIYHAWSDGTSPIELTVSVFHKDHSVSTSKVTAAGPAVTVVSWDCSPVTESPWTMTASTTGESSSIYCSIESYAGQVATASHFGESGGPATVSCSGSPGGR